MAPTSSSQATTPAMTESPQQAASTPASSPPPRPDVDDGDIKGTAKSQLGVSETMEEEERKMAAISRKDEEDRDRKLREDRQQDIKGGEKAVDSKFKALEYLLSQSKVRAMKA